jgi:hypothetical protein
LCAEVKKKLATLLKNINVLINKLAILCRNAGLIALLRGGKKSKTFSYIARSEHLVTRYFNDENIMKTILQTVSCIRSYANNDRQLRNSPE